MRLRQPKRRLPGLDGTGSLYSDFERALPAMKTEVVADAPHLVLQRRPVQAGNAIKRWAGGLGVRERPA